MSYSTSRKKYRRNDADLGKTDEFLSYIRNEITEQEGNQNKKIVQHLFINMEKVFDRI